MECPNCHHWNEAGSRFCEECGFEFAALANAPRTPAQVSLREEGEPAPDSLPIEIKPSGNGHSGAAVPPSTPESISGLPSKPVSGTVFTGAYLTLDSTGSIFKLGDVTIVGREDPTLQIDFDGYTDGKYISHRHAQIVRTETGYYLEDLNSANHTYKNTVRLSVGQAEPLHEGDKVRFGKIELVFHEQ
jgi:pSer/pThr/pTyr-binding forkhead associated (FHA) protein